MGQIKTSYVCKYLALPLRINLYGNNGGHKRFLHNNIINKRNNKYRTLHNNILQKELKWQLSN